MTSEKLLQNLPFLGKDKDGKLILDDEKAGKLRKALNEDKEPETHIKAFRTLSAEILPLAVEHIKSLSKTKADLEERIAKLTSSQPSTSPAHEAASTGDEDDGLSLAEKIRRTRLGR